MWVYGTCRIEKKGSSDELAQMLSLVRAFAAHIRKLWT